MEEGVKVEETVAEVPVEAEAKTEEVAAKPISEEEARKVLVDAQNKKVQACLEEVTAVLKKHGCTMIVEKPEIRIVPVQ